MFAASASSFARCSETLPASASSFARCSETFAAWASCPWRIARVVVERSSIAARYSVMPKITASAASAIENTLSKARLAMISAPSCTPARIAKERPTSVMKNAALVIEPNTIAT